MRQIRAHRAGRPAQAANGVAGHARVLLKDLLTATASGRHRRRLLRQPRVELVGRVRYDAYAHPRVLQAAILVARAVVGAWSVYYDPHGVGLARHQVLHPPKVRHMKTVNHVDRLETDLQRRTDGHVYL